MRPQGKATATLCAIASAAFGLVLLIFALYVLNEVLPSQQKKKALAGEIVTSLEAKVEPTASDETPPEPKPESQDTSEDLAPLDLMAAGDDHALHASGLFAVSSGAGGLMGQVADELNRVADMGSLDETPQRQSQGSPLVYPTEARAQGLEGHVTVNLLVGKDGRVLKALLMESQPQGVFDEPALNAARSWVFTPPRRNNEAVQVWLKQTIRFDLEE
jgi:TonB family protein